MLDIIFKQSLPEEGAEIVVREILEQSSSLCTKQMAEITKEIIVLILRSLKAKTTKF